MSAEQQRRSLQDLIDAESPLRATRAAAVAVAIARHLERLEQSGFDGGSVTADRLVLAADASVSLTGTGGRQLSDVERDPDGPEISTEAGASVGRLLFELLTGRRPLGRQDAFEPAVVESLSPELCTLMARSLSDAPGQWPNAQQWRVALEEAAGGGAPALPPAEAAAEHRRRVLTVVGLVILIVSTLVILALVPRWWGALDDESGGAQGTAWRTGSAQVSRASS